MSGPLRINRKFSARACREFIAATPQKSPLQRGEKSRHSGRAISAYLVEHGINTEAFGECASACARIFLGGKSRILAPGGTLGFHRPWIVKEREKRFYEANRIKEKWEEEFDYVPWIYDVALQDMLEGIKFMRSRDVDIEFILKIYSTSSYDLWEPSLEELLEAGVLTE